MTRLSPPPTVALLAALALCACARQPSLSKSAQADLSACRQQADAAYVKQNPALISERNNQDSPFSANSTVGVTSAGLGERYARDQMLQACLDNSATGAASGSQPSGTATLGTDRGAGATNSPDSGRVTLPGSRP